MALNKYIYKDIQPEITETFPNLHVDDEKLISLFKEWGFDIIINGNVSWNLTFVQNNGYAIGFNQYQAIKIKKPHRYVDRIIFKNIDKSIKQEQNVTDGNYILVTNPTIYLSEISYRMDATNCYLWSVYGNGQFQPPTQQNVNFLKNLRLQVDTEQLDPASHPSAIYINPSISQKYQYSKNSKYGFNGYYGDFIHLKTDSDLIKPNVKIKGQYNYNTSIQGSYPIEEGQYWGTESNEKIIDIIQNDFYSSTGTEPIISYDSEEDKYEINGRTYYFPSDVTFYIVKKENFNWNASTNTGWRRPGTDLKITESPGNPDPYAFAAQSGVVAAVVTSINADAEGPANITIPAPSMYYKKFKYGQGIPNTWNTTISSDNFLNQHYITRTVSGSISPFGDQSKAWRIRASAPQPNQFADNHNTIYFAAWGNKSWDKNINVSTVFQTFDFIDKPLSPISFNYFYNSFAMRFYKTNILGTTYWMTYGTVAWSFSGFLQLFAGMAGDTNNNFDLLNGGSPTDYSHWQEWSGGGTDWVDTEKRVIYELTTNVSTPQEVGTLRPQSFYYTTNENDYRPKDRYSNWDCTMGARLQVSGSQRGYLLIAVRDPIPDRTL